MGCCRGALKIENRMNCIPMANTTKGQKRMEGAPNPKARKATRKAITKVARSEIPATKVKGDLMKLITLLIMSYL